MGKVWQDIGAAVWDAWVWYTGVVWEQYWSGGMASGVKRYIRKVPDDALNGHIFQNLSSWLGFKRTKVSVSTKKEDVIGDLEVPDDVLDLLLFRRNGHLGAIKSASSI